MRRVRTGRWRPRRGPVIPYRYVTRREIQEAANIDAILFDQLRAQGHIPENPKPWEWSGVRIWYRADLPQIVAGIHAELERRRRVARELFSGGTTPSE